MIYQTPGISRTGYKQQSSMNSTATAKPQNKTGTSAVTENKTKSRDQTDSCLD